jgi:hypothetical protein
MKEIAELSSITLGNQCCEHCEHIMTDLCDALRILREQEKLLATLRPLVDAYGKGGPAAGLAAARRMRRR